MMRVLVCTALCGLGVSGSRSSSCADPVAAVKKTIECLKAKDVSCVNDGYNMDEFTKYHNDNKVELRWPSDIYWSKAMKYSTWNVQINRELNIETNKASVRYKDIIRTGPRTIIYQYEHALVSVDNNCKITRWDQYGDNEEQQEEQDALDVVLQEEEDAEFEQGSCADPVAAVKKTIECLKAKDVSCVNDGYNLDEFTKYHNDNKVELRWPSDIYWSQAMKYSTWNVQINRELNIETNKASVRYKDIIRTGPRTIIYQYEHALVSVDNNCKITRWDQYGDNVEQQEEQDALDVILSQEGQ